MRKAREATADTLAELTTVGQPAAFASAERQHNALARILREGAAKAELAKDADIEALAWYFLGVFQAVLNFPQVGADMDALSHMIDVAMPAWLDTNSSS